MKPPSPLPESLAAIPFTVSEALNAGVHRGRLQNSVLVTPSRGVRAPADSRMPDGGPSPSALLQLSQLASPVTRVTGLSAASHAGTPGIRKARLALAQARVGADSAPETRLRLALERAGLPEARLNVTTALLPGVERQPDLAYPEYRVAVEYEGEGHSDPAQFVRDIAREEDFGSAGWTLVRISRRHMENDARAAVRKVRSALQAAGWSATG